MITFLDALETLLRGPENDEVQTLYLRLKNGKTLVFLGAPIKEEDFDQLDDIHVGELVPIEFIGSGQGPRPTAQ
jgi:hypothetical protein